MNPGFVDPIAEFRHLCARAEDAFSRPDSSGNPDLLPFGVRLLALIAEHPDQQADFEQAFRDLWAQRFIGPWELLPFCMHHLRWPTFERFMQGVLREASTCDDWRTIPRASHILEAFRDDWPDSDLWHAEA